MKPGPTTRELEAHLSVNPASPLFARLAENFLKTGEISRAERLCERGLELYPDYPTGLLVHARCLAARGRYADALDSIGGVVSRYPGNIVLGGIEAEWGELDGLAMEREATEAAVFTVVEAGDPSGAFAESAMVATADPTGDVSKNMAVDVVPEASMSVTAATMEADEAVGLAPDLMTDGASLAIDITGAPSDDPRDTGAPAPMPVPSPGAAPVPLLQPIPPSGRGRGFIEHDRIVSRTLAEIYASQGAISEAVETYRLLLRRMPDQRESLGGRLRELEDRLRNEPGERPSPAE